MITIHEDDDYHQKDLIQIEFYQLSDEQLKIHVAYKVLSLKHRLEMCEERLQDVLDDSGRVGARHTEGKSSFPLSGSNH
jgi:peroxiredoxin